jgi:hypothetical protein
LFFWGQGSAFLRRSWHEPQVKMNTGKKRIAGMRRVYDRAHKDYHNWDDNENHAWGQFLTENHKSSHEYSKANKKEQSQYWNYRHAHPDKN